MGSYWQRRRARADARLGKAERNVAKRAEAYYREELKRLEKEIAAFYAEFAEGQVDAYKAAFKKLSADDERMLWEDCDRFAAEHPERAWMVPVRKGMYRLTRLEGLQHSARLGLAKATARTEDLLTGHFEEAAREAAKAVSDTMGFDFYDDGAVRRFVGTKWADGKSFSERIWDNTAKLAEYVSGDMAKALARGDSYAKLRDEIARRFVGQSVSNIMRVVQTEGTYVSRQVQGEEMKRAGFDAYYIDSVEDKHTCGTCRSISKLSHERPFRFEDAKPGENYPPLHPRCRCEVNPAVDDWADFIKGGNGRPQDRAKVAERFGVNESEAFVPGKGGKSSVSVDRKAVNSKAYHDKYSGIPVTKAARESLYKLAGSILSRNDGTMYEDLVAIDARTGVVIAATFDNPRFKSSARFTKEQAAAVEARGVEFVLLHNHPNSTAPSAQDVVMALRRERLSCSVVACHDGDVFCIVPLKRIGALEAWELIYNNSCLTVSNRNDATALAFSRFEELNRSEKWYEIKKL